MFIFNQGANQSKYRYALPAILTAGLSDSLISIAVIGISIIIMSMPILQAIIYAIGLIFYCIWLGQFGTKTFYEQPSKSDVTNEAS